MEGPWQKKSNPNFQKCLRKEYILLSLIISLNRFEEEFMEACESYSALLPPGMSRSPCCSLSLEHSNPWSSGKGSSLDGDQPGPSSNTTSSRKTPLTNLGKLPPILLLTHHSVPFPYFILVIILLRNLLPYVSIYQVCVLNSPSPYQNKVPAPWSWYRPCPLPCPGGLELTLKLLLIIKQTQCRKNCEISCQQGGKKASMLFFFF